MSQRNKKTRSRNAARAPAKQEGDKSKTKVSSVKFAAGTKRIADDTPCPIHPGMGHTWYDCKSNRYGKHKDSESNGKSNNNGPSNKKAKTSGAFHAAEEDDDLHEAEMALQQEMEEFNLDDVPLDAGNFPEMHDQFMNCFHTQHLDSPESIASQSKQDSDPIHAYMSNANNAYTTGIDIPLDNSYLESTPLHHQLKLRPISTLLIRSIQNHKNSIPFKFLGDSGADNSWINRRCLPKGVVCKTMDKPIRTINGTSLVKNYVEITDLTLPEFKPTERHTNKTIVMVSTMIAALTISSWASIC